MSTSSSRMQMVNLRDKKGYESGEYQAENSQTNQQIFKFGASTGSGSGLSMPNQDSVGYEPSNVTFQSRTATRILKGKFDRGASQDKQRFTSITPSDHSKTDQTVFSRNRLEENPNSRTQLPNNFGTSALGQFTSKNPISRPSNQGLKLILPDQEDYISQKDKKLTSLLQLSDPKQPQPVVNKRINIERRQQSREMPRQIRQVRDTNEPVETKQPKQVKEVKEQKKTVPPPAQKKQTLIEEVPIAQLKPQKTGPEQDIIENQNQLVDCTEGCGRKFNKKALESHAKACKLVFMSKRKEYNSQANRMTSKQQATLVKQAKQKQKKETVTKLQKTGQAWKTQSEGFRAVIKALKQQDPQEVNEQKEVKLVTCEFCEKKFSQVLISKHIPICEVKREKDKKSTKKAPKK